MKSGRDNRDLPVETTDMGKEFVVKINRCATVVKGGRRFNFSALVVIGNQNGKIGIGFGKANEVPQAVQKALNDARKSTVTVPLYKDTITHEVMGQYRATKVFLKPAVPGTGVIAGSAVRAVVEAAGIKDVFSKAYGSSNPINMTKAALNGLMKLRTHQEVAELRGVSLNFKCRQ